MFQNWDFTSGESKLAASYNLTPTQAPKMAKQNSALKSTLANDNTILLHFNKQSHRRGYIHSPNQPAQLSAHQMPRWLLLYPMLSSKPRSPFPHACPCTQRKFYYSESSLLHSEGFERLSSKNENKHQTELWKHQTCF